MTANAPRQDVPPPAGPDHPDAPPPPPGQELTSQDRTMGMLCHILAMGGSAVPFGNIIGPLVIWLTHKERSAFVDDQGRESLRWQVLVTVVSLVVGALMVVSAVGAAGPFLLGFVVMLALAAVNITYVVIASVKASQGEWFRYPFSGGNDRREQTQRPGE